MALVVKDRVQEVSTTTGTGTFTLAGAFTGFQAFSVIGDGNTTYYAVVGGTEWEVGIGTYTALGTVLSRDTILESSNGGTAVNFSAGTKNVFVTYPAEKGLYLDASNTFSLSGTNGIINATWTTAGRPSAPSTGQVGFNTTTGLIDCYDGTSWKSILNTGIIGSLYNISYLLVAGGGGGGQRVGGGGGAGGLLFGTSSLSVGTSYTITIGAGGAGSTSSGAKGTSGNNTTALSLTATGGGGGGSLSSTTGASGGSGGGGSFGGAGGAGTSGQGFAGGAGTSSIGAAPAGGGGGAGAVGENFTTSPIKAGNGGIGVASSITGSSVYYAGGGGGGVSGGTAGSGGNGGGGAGSNASTGGANGVNGTANTGGGGGGGGDITNGGTGGSGVVILSVPTIFYSGTTTGSPTITTSSLNTIITFTASGTYTA